MTMQAELWAFVRGLVAPNYSESREDVQPSLNNRGDLIVAQGLPELAELVRMGETWTIVSTTGQAALTALPATVAGLSLVNSEPATGKSFVIDSFGSWEAVLDATQTDVTAIFAMLNKRGSTPPASGTAETGFRSHSGRSASPSSVAASRGATVINDGWNPHATSGQMAAAAAGANWKVNEVQARGLYLVPPGGAFSVQAVKAAAAAAAQQFFFCRYHAVQLIYAT